MYKEHDCFLQPDDVDIKVWRYIDFSVLIDLIDSEELFFARADQFSDPLEGSVPQNDKKKREEFSSGIAGDPGRVLEEAMRSPQMSNCIENMRKSTAISCWHMNEYESALMWNSYSGDGVAIQSTYKRLKNSLINSEENIFLGIVNYIDYSSGELVNQNLRLSQYIHKSFNYIDEREVRGVISKNHMQDLGVRVKIDISTLIENIFLSPRMPAWKAKLIKNIINKYNHSFNIINTSINMKVHY